MKRITKKEIKALAKEYGRSADELSDFVADWEDEGIIVTAGMLDDFLANDDI